MPILEKLRCSLCDVRIRRALLRQSRAWKDLSRSRTGTLQRRRSDEKHLWSAYRELRAERLDDIATIIHRNATLRAIASNLGLSRLDLVEAYRKLIRHTARPWAVEPYHAPTALMLLPAWLEAVGALYLSGGLEAGAHALEDALITMDATYPLTVLEPLVLSGRLPYEGLTA